MIPPQSGFAQRVKAMSRRQRLAIAASILVVALVGSWMMLGRSTEKPNDRRASESSTPDSVVTLDSTGQRLAGIELYTVQRGGTGELVANGSITYDANKVSVVSPHIDGRVVSVRADLGQTVQRGSVLAVLESPEIGQMRGDLERASANADIARRNYEREKRLFEQQITPQKEMLEAEAAFRTAEADRRSAIARLGSIGASGAGHGSGASFGLVAPVSGTVVERNASPGQTVGPSVNLFTVADLRSLWITVDVYEGDLARVRQGASAVVTVPAFANEKFSGRVTYAGGVIDPDSRTFKVRVEVPNVGLRLRPGMFAQVRIPTVANALEPGNVSIPEAAVQEINGTSVVFVSATTVGRYVARKVTLGAKPSEGVVTITSGLSEGERVAVKGAFQLGAELEKSSGGENEE
jgi:cobalt-zinc-cadmium efflux system membrane fusion protein